MELLIDFGWLTLGLVLLYFGAEWLVQGAASLSLKIGLAPLIVGLTVVAFGTSAPELLVSLQANLEDPPKGGFALGNIIGSNICNIALILGVAAMIRPIPVPRDVIKRDLPLMVLVTLGFVWILNPTGANVLGWLSDFSGEKLYESKVIFVEAIILVVVLLGFIILSIVSGLKSNEEAEVEGMDSEEVEAAKKAPASKVLFFVFLVIIGLAVLAVGANRLIEGGVGIAKSFGVSDVIIALTLVSLGTSLPELATSIIASRKKQGDIIVGNVIGSNLFNILAVIGVTGVVAPLISSELGQLDILLMLGLTFLGSILMLTKKTLGRVEGGIMLLIYAGYIVYLYLQNAAS